MRPESGCIHNVRHNEKYTLHPRHYVCDKRWRRVTELGQSSSIWWYRQTAINKEILKNAVLAPSGRFVGIIIIADFAISGIDLLKCRFPKTPTGEFRKTKNAVSMLAPSMPTAFQPHSYEQTLLHRLGLLAKIYILLTG